MDPRALGALVRSRRKKRGLDQRELANLAGVSLGTVQNIEGAKVRKPHQGNLEAILAVLDLPLGSDGDAADDPTEESGEIEWPPDVEAFRDIIGLYLMQFDPATRVKVMRVVNRQIIFSAKPHHESE